jgi:hypothetical protein
MTTHQPPPPPSKPPDQPEPQLDGDPWQTAADPVRAAALALAEHARRRREWTAALRWFAMRNRRVENWMSAEHLAERIEDGTLTPWADTNPVACPNCRGTGAAAHPLVPSRICEDCKGTGTCSPPADTPEPDEPVADVLAAFERGPHGVTSPPPPWVAASGVKLDEPSGQRTATAQAAEPDTTEAEPTPVLARLRVALDAGQDVPDADLVPLAGTHREALAAAVRANREQTAEVERLRAELATARRDAAAAALEMAGARLAATGHHPAADLVRDLEAQIRAGTRPVPGSPEPAPRRSDGQSQTGDAWNSWHDPMCDGRQHPGRSTCDCGASPGSPEPARDFYAMHDHGYHGWPRHAHHIDQQHSEDVHNPRANDHTGVPVVTQAEATAPGTTQPTPEPAGTPPADPPPAGGPGWDRTQTGAALHTPWEELHGLAEVVRLVQELDAARAELATARGAVAAAGAGWDREAAELARRDAELAEAVEANRRWAADHAEQAAELAAAVTERDAQVGIAGDVRRELREVTVERDRLERLTAADLETMARMRGELATARRDAEMWERAAGDMEARDRHAAADTLDWAAGQWVREVVGTNEWPTRDQLHEWAAEIRAGSRPVPGNPEPAPAGGEEPEHG